MARKAAEYPLLKAAVTVGSGHQDVDVVLLSEQIQMAAGRTGHQRDAGGGGHIMPLQPGGYIAKTTVRAFSL